MTDSATPWTRRGMIAAGAATMALGAQAKSPAQAKTPQNTTLFAAADPSGMTGEALKKLDAPLKALVDEGHRAGVVYAVARGGKLIARKAHGWRNLENKVPMTEDTIFRIYSMSRAVTGSAVLSLVDEGKISLDDPVAKYIPAVADMQVIKEVLNDQVVGTEPQATPMTLRHLFNYTSGLGYAPAWPRGVGIQQRDILALDQTTEQGIAKLTRYPLLHQPGTKWRYGFHSDVLARVAEVVSGKPFNVFLRERVTGKLGMSDTDFWMDESKVLRFADVYRLGPDGKLVNSTALTPASSTYTKPGTFFSGGGGLASTVTDYLRFAEMLRLGGTSSGATVLSPAIVKQMTTNALTPSQGGEVYWNDLYAIDVMHGYGWGLALGIRLPDAQAPSPHTVPGTAGDFGWYGLCNTIWFVDPKEEIVAVAMAQYQGVGERRLAGALRAGVYAAIGRG